MGVFLFLKQFVDMLYQFKILDYGMVLFAIGLLGYKVIKDKSYIGIKEKICLADVCIAGLCVIFTVSFLRDTSFYANFFKIQSAFLIYVLGRVYARNLLEYGRTLSLAGYVVIYANFFYRLYQFGGKLIIKDNLSLLDTGAFYYYKTDLAVGILIATIFVYLFGKNRILKWITVVPVAGYMVFYSNARMGMIAMVLEYLLIAGREIGLYQQKKREQKQIKPKEGNLKKVSTRIVIALVWVLAIGILLFIQLFVKGNTTFQPYRMDEKGNIPLLEKIFHSRHVIWWEVMQYFSEQSIFTRFLGIDLGTEYLHNAAMDRMHSTYFKLIYSTGYVGVVFMAGWISAVLKRLSKCKNSQMIYITLALMIEFLFMGLTVESLELTQMSWFMMLFSGAAVTLGAEINE